MQDIPEYAIQTFEKLTGKTICAHALNPGFGSVSRSRFRHLFPYCDKFKRESNAFCLRFDCFFLRNNIWKYPVGGLKICPAGLLEWFAPVLCGGECVGILFAAGNRPPDVSPKGLPIILSEENLARMDASVLPEISPEEIGFVMEALRQLAARLTLWYAESVRNNGEGGTLPRQDIIRNFFEKHYQGMPTLQDLADELYLSPGRTAHLVREATGACFRTLLMQTRLVKAAALLMQTQIPVDAVATESGFRDVSHFFRAFRAHFRMTPAQYRAGRRN